MKHKQEIQKLNQLIDDMDLPEEHLLRSYQANSIEFLSSQVNQPTVVFFIDNYISVLQEYLFASNNYHLLLLLMNREDDLSERIRSYVKTTNRYSEGYIDKLVTEIKAAIAQLKSNNLPTESYEEDLEKFLHSISHQNQEMFFNIRFLEFMWYDINVHANILPEPAVENHQPNIFMTIILMCFNLFTTNFPVLPVQENNNNNNEVNASETNVIKTTDTVSSCDPYADSIS